MTNSPQTDNLPRSGAIARFLAELDRFDGPISLPELTRRLAALEITVDDVRRWVCFGRSTYQRNLLHAGPNYHALVLCWRSGQRSPIHDHRGSACGVRVLQGTAVETRFAFSPDGLAYAVDSRELPEGSICGSNDADTHQMSNLQPAGCDLVTLHVYSPPLLTMGQYSITDSGVREFVDPIIGFEEGDGI